MGLINKFSIGDYGAFGGTVRWLSKVIDTVD